MRAKTEEARIAITAKQLIQLALAASAMVAVASVQEAWSLFVTPLQQRLGGGPVALVQVQSAFSVFIMMQTMAVPLSGIIADRHAPSVTLVPAALLFAGGWWLSARADTMFTLSISIGICAVGVGTVYSTCTAHAIKWFPHHRGLAAGVTSCGYGAGAGLFLFQLQSSILAHGASTTTQWWSIALGSVVLLAGMLMTPPPASAVHSIPTSNQLPTGAHNERSLPPAVVVRRPLFQWCYLAMLLIAMTGLVITAQLKPIAQFYGVADLPAVGSVPVLLVALQIDMIFLGLLRPLWGVLSDKVGRARTLVWSFSAQTILTVLYWYGVTRCQPRFAALTVAFLTGPTFAGYGVSVRLVCPTRVSF
jgi:OFA family oxalate/formate antiporter-like MFS transporter